MFDTCVIHLQINSVIFETDILIMFQDRLEMQMFILHHFEFPLKSMQLFWIFLITETR